MPLAGEATKRPSPTVAWSRDKYCVPRSNNRRGRLDDWVCFSAVFFAPAGRFVGSRGRKPPVWSLAVLTGVEGFRGDNLCL